MPEFASQPEPECYSPPSLCGFTFLVQLSSIISAFGASCVPCTRVLGLESTDHAGPHCTCALCVSAARQLTTTVRPSHIICAARTASSLRASCRHSRRLILSADQTFLSCTRRGRRHSTAAFPLFYRARAARGETRGRTISNFFDEDEALLCRFCVDFQLPAARTSSSLDH